MQQHRSSTAISLVLLVSACATSPLGHQQLKLLPEEQLQEMGEAAFARARSDGQALDDAQLTDYVNCVVRHVTDQLQTRQQWEVAVLKDDSANAFALPGGKIGVNSGLLSVAKNQDQLAAVIGHEVAHVTAGHHNARLSAAYAADAAQTLAAVVAGGGENSQQIMGLLGLGVQYGVIMPYGRSQETEADLLGLRYMSKAGFDPSASIALWRNMEQAGGPGPPAFLSTHPSPTGRIDRLQDAMPEAEQLYRAARNSGARPACK